MSTLTNTSVSSLIVTLHLFDDVAMSQVAEHYESRLDGNIRDVADSLIAAADELKDSGDSCYELTKGRLLNVLYDLQGAGVDTTSKTILWLILYMAKYPAVQKRVQDEIDCTVDQTNMPCLDDKPHLIYTNAVIHEVMRIETIIPTSLPHYAMKDSYIQGKKVDKDTVVLFNLHSLAYEATVWGDPTNFRPDRFLKEDGGLDIKMTAQSHPFSLGRRRCIGEQLAIMNIFLFFSGLMKKCTFELCENPEVDTIPGLVYAPEKL
ncbi:CP1A1-like protein, partial [Mya arenaria]